jgi:hypothetical protein
MPTMIRKAQQLAGDARRKATGMATDMAVKAAGRMAGGVVSKVADEAGKLAGRLNPARPDADAIKVDVRKIVTMVEEIRHEGGPSARKPCLRGAIAAVVANPFAGRYVQDLTPMMDALKPLGYQLAAELIKALGGPKKVDAYGKSVIVGVAGESEHAALWHVPGGYGMRELLDKSLAIVPSTIKVAAAGAIIDVPLHHRTAAYVRSHFDSVEMRVPDAPRPDEIVFILAMGAGGRVHERMGGLRASEISKFDGQR